MECLFLMNSGSQGAGASQRPVVGFHQASTCATCPCFPGWLGCVDCVELVVVDEAGHKIIAAMNSETIAPITIKELLDDLVVFLGTSMGS